MFSLIGEERNHVEYAAVLRCNYVLDFKKRMVPKQNITATHYITVSAANVSLSSNRLSVWANARATDSRSSTASGLLIDVLH